VESYTGHYPIHSLIVAPVVLPQRQAPVHVEERISERQINRFREVLSDPRNLAYFHADALIALIPTGDPEAVAASLHAARRARRRQRRVQFLFTSTNNTTAATTPATEFVVDLREAAWGAASQERLGGWTAAELRAILGSIIADEQIWGPRTDGSEDVVILNGQQIYLLDEPEEGLFTCIAPL
jgi:hypothetical protein